MAVGKYAQSLYASRIIVLVVLVGGCVVPDVDSLEYLSVGTAPRLFTTGPPFSEAGAAGALAVSRRQSKWIEVEQSGSGQGIGTWVVRPQHQNSSSVVIVIHEIFGVNDWVLAVADKLAENGFVALVPDLQAAVVYYGRAPTQPTEYKFVKTSVLGLYGGDDELVNETIIVAEQEMARRGTQFISEVFLDAGHGFLRAQEGHDGANRFASDLAWRRTIEFLDRNLVH